jgi:hypothetical protein
LEKVSVAKYKSDLFAEAVVENLKIVELVMAEYRSDYLGRLAL